MVFPVVTHGCKGWTIKKAEHRRIDAFKSWFWRRLLRVPWTARRSNQSIQKEINPEYSLEGLNWCWSWISNTLASWWENWLIGKDPDAGKDWGQKEKMATENEMIEWHHCFNRHECEQTPGDGEGQVSLACYSPWSHKELDMNTEQLNNNDKSFRPRWSIQSKLHTVPVSSLCTSEEQITNRTPLIACVFLERMHLFLLPGQWVLHLSVLLKKKD